MEPHDSAVRLAAFRFLEEQTQRHPDGLVPRAVLQQGFDFRGSRVPLVGPQGIFKPAILEVPLSITTVPPSDRSAQWVERFDVRISDEERVVGSEDDFDSMFSAAALLRCVLENVPLAAVRVDRCFEGGILCAEAIVF
jgi:hypothetical protein